MRFINESTDDSRPDAMMMASLGLIPEPTDFGNEIIAAINYECSTVLSLTAQVDLIKQQIVIEQEYSVDPDDIIEQIGAFDIDTSDLERDFYFTNTYLFDFVNHTDAFSSHVSQKDSGMDISKYADVVEMAPGEYETTESYDLQALTFVDNYQACIKYVVDVISSMYHNNEMETKMDEMSTSMKEHIERTYSSGDDDEEYDEEVDDEEEF